MSVLLITAVAVFVLLATAVPGYILIKKKMLSEDCIPGFSKVLLYVCQPCLAVYTFHSADFSLDMLPDLGLFFLAALIIHGIMLLGGYLVLRKKYDDVIYRVTTIAVTFTNSAFFGIPIIEALLPDAAAGLMMYTTIYALIMNILGWTVGSFIVSGDRRYISLKKMLINPATIGVVVGIPFLLFNVPLPSNMESMITVLGRMTSPLSMLIMGMRLATTSFKNLFCRPLNYGVVGVKGMIMPLVAYLVVMLLPMSLEVKQAFYIITACPTASIVLNFSELCGHGQKEAAATMLLSTILSIVTLPIMMLLL